MDIIALKYEFAKILAELNEPIPLDWLVLLEAEGYELSAFFK